MNPNRTYLYRRKAKAYTPAGRCALRLAVSAAALAVMLIGFGIWTYALHLQHAMGVPLLIAAVVLAVWLAAFLIFLPGSRYDRCSASFIVYDAASARLWMLPTFSFTGDPAQDMAAADTIVNTDAFQKYSDLTQASISFEKTGWVLAGVDAKGMPVTRKLSPSYQRIGDTPAPQSRSVLAGNILCGVLLGIFLIAGALWILADKAAEYRQMNACIDEVSALVASVYPEYALDTEFEHPHPGECYLYFHDASSEDYYDAKNFTRINVTIQTDGGEWYTDYLSVTGWYREGEDLSQPLALCRALDPKFENLSLKRFEDNWGDLQAEFADPDTQDGDAYEKLAGNSDEHMGIYVSLRRMSSYTDSYYSLPEGLAGYYYFDYSHYRY
jgi:hypothetical protein